MSTPTNADRASRARSALQAYILARDGDLKNDKIAEHAANVIDMVTDLQHLCAEDGVDFDSVVLSAVNHFKAEAPDGG